MINAISRLSPLTKMGVAGLGIAGLACLTGKVNAKTMVIISGLSLLAAGLSYALNYPSKQEPQTKKPSTPRSMAAPKPTTSASTSAAPPPKKSLEELKNDFLGKVAEKLSSRTKTLATIRFSANECLEKNPLRGDFCREYLKKMNELHEHYKSGTRLASDPYLDPVSFRIAVAAFEETFSLRVSHNHDAFAQEYSKTDLESRQLLNMFIFKQTQRAIQQGFKTSEGTWIETLIEPSATLIYPVLFPQENLNPYHKTEIEFVNQSTFEASKRLLEQGLNPLVLIMSNKSKIGGDPETAGAQEETCCRQSTLYQALASLPKMNGDDKRYDPNITNTLFKGGGILSRNVSVLREGPNEGFKFIKPLHFKTFNSAAFDSNKDHKSPDGYDCPKTNLEYEAGMAVRIRTMLKTAVDEECDSVVLGAFGCGAFQNDPKRVAELYKRILNMEFRGQFKKVVFAITDSRRTRNLETFKETFVDNPGQT